MSLRIVSARPESQGIKIRCPHCKFQQRVDVSFVEDAIMENGVIICVACDKVFRIVSVSLSRAAEQRDEADGELAGKAPNSLSTKDK